MKLFKVTRVSFATTLSIVLCAAVISSCGSSKDSKKSGTPIIGSTPTVNDDGVPAAPLTEEPKKDANGIPQPTNSDGSVAAPVGKVPLNSGPGNSETKKSNAPDFKDAKAVLTGGTAGDLHYTSASDDGIMEAFRTTATTVGAEQQKLNKNLAGLITGARLKKAGAEMLLDITTKEFEAAKIYKLKAVNDGSKMKLSLLSSTGDMEFQGGFLKCLEDSCEDAYAKIKVNGAYTRIIFRTTEMNNNFRIQEKITDANFKLWTSYIYNTIEGSGGDAQISSVRASSYEILNGKSAIGIQMLTKNKEAFSLGTPLLAPETGTALVQQATKYADPSGNYNLARTSGKSFNLSKAVSSVSLVNNNGKGDLKLKLSIDSGSIWMVLSRVPKTTMSAAQVKAFETTVPNF